MLFALKIPTKIARYTRHTQQQQIAAWQRICHARRPLKSRRHGTSFSPAKPQNKTLWSGIPIIPSIDGHRHLGPIPRPPTSPAWISIPEGRIRPRLLRRHRILANHRSPSCNFAVKLLAAEPVAVTEEKPCPPVPGHPPASLPGGHGFLPAVFSPRNFGNSTF